MQKRLKQLQALSIAEWQVLLLSLLLLPMIALALKLKGLKWTQALLTTYQTKNSTIPIPENLQLRLAQGTAHMVSVAANHGPYRANCLKKSLAIWWLLKREGITTELSIGVNKESGNFNAHAWVEWQGIVLVDSADVGERFSVFGSNQTRSD